MTVSAAVYTKTDTEQLVLLKSRYLIRYLTKTGHLVDQFMTPLPLARRMHAALVEQSGGLLQLDES